MKILQIIQKPQFRGAEIFACQLSVELIKLGHEVDILFLTGNEDEILPFQLKFIYLKANLKRRFWDFKAYNKLNLIIKNGNYDIVQANAADTLKYSAISKYLYNWEAKLVYRNANKIGDFLNNKSKKIVNGLFVKKIDLVASVSERCKNDFFESFPFFRKNIAYLPIGVNLEKTTPYNSFSEIGLSFDSANVFIHVGSFVPEKNHIGLLSIFKKYLEYDENAKLILVGEGKLKSDIAKIVNEYRLDKNIVMLGKRADVLKILPLCKALLLPSLIEGLPGVVLEAMLSKTIVIANNVGGIGEVVISNQTGFLVEKGDEIEFVNSMKYSVFKQSTMLIKNAYTLINDNFNNHMVAQKFEMEYNKL